MPTWWHPPEPLRTAATKIGPSRVLCRDRSFPPPRILVAASRKRAAADAQEIGTIPHIHFHVADAS
jgi:hypothetical protein